MQDKINLFIFYAECIVTNPNLLKKREQSKIYIENFVNPALDRPYIKGLYICQWRIMSVEFECMVD